MPYFVHQRQYGNAATRELSKLPLHLGYLGCKEPPGEVQAKPSKVFNNATSRHRLGIPLFKVSELMF